MFKNKNYGNNLENACLNQGREISRSILTLFFANNVKLLGTPRLFFVISILLLFDKLSLKNIDMPPVVPHYLYRVQLKNYIFILVLRGAWILEEV